MFSISLILYSKKLDQKYNSSLMYESIEVCIVYLVTSSVGYLFFPGTFFSLGNLISDKMSQLLLRNLAHLPYTLIYCWEQVWWLFVSLLLKMSNKRNIMFTLNCVLWVVSCCYFKWLFHLIDICRKSSFPPYNLKCLKLWTISILILYGSIHYFLCCEHKAISYVEFGYTFWCYLDTSSVKNPGS